MITLSFGRFLKIPFRPRERVYYLSDDSEPMEGVVDSVDINFLGSGKAVDIDFIVHPVTDNGEDMTAEFFSDWEINNRIFKSKRRAEKAAKSR